MSELKYYFGIDMGTNSTGYAATDTKYNLLRYKGEPVWGTTVFTEGSLCDERRGFRSHRRTLARRKQRIQLVQELFAKEIAAVDPRFFIRLAESKLYGEDSTEKYSIFNDKEYTDKEYHSSYPTIHHLICDLMTNKETHDVRLVYLAISWLVSNRGHFYSNIDKHNTNTAKDFAGVYDRFIAYFESRDYSHPWDTCDIKALAEELTCDCSISAKEKNLKSFLYNGKSPSKEPTEDFPYNRQAIIKLLAGGTCKLSDVFCNETYKDIEPSSISLGSDPDVLDGLRADLDEDYELIEALRSVYDWAILSKILTDSNCISEAKVKEYNQHKADLKTLKYLTKKYLTKTDYKEMFIDNDKPNYSSYSGHSTQKKASYDDFSKFIQKKFKDIEIEEEDKNIYNDMDARLKAGTFLPKQRSTSNRVVPYQLYWAELDTILKNAEGYLPFLKEQDDDGLSVSDKIRSIFEFQIPYFVGPLNNKSEFAWLKRKEGRIYPWNFEKMVDLEASEEAFIRRMTNTCTYIPGEYVLPKDSLMYHKFTVLNTINCLRINGTKISVELKQDIYNNVFLRFKKVTKKKITDYLLSVGAIEKGEERTVTGVDETIGANLIPQIEYKKFLEIGMLSEDDVESIINRSTFAEDKTRLSAWLEKEYPRLSIDDRKYICRIKANDFGRISRRFLTEIIGASLATGEAYTIIQALWETNDNLMELLSERYTFSKAVDEVRQTYYSQHPMSLEERLDEMYASGQTKRSVYRALAILDDVMSVYGAPEKIFLETTRGGREEMKGKRTKSRKQQLLDLYSICKDEDVRAMKEQLEAMGDTADQRLQSDKLFLYYIQLGRCMYTGKPIDLNNLSSEIYDIDHIYPQAFVKDDSIVNNRVLVFTKVNGDKSCEYPIDPKIQNKMRPTWEMLRKAGLIAEEKFKRLVRTTPFSLEEKWTFINRQLTTTSQSVKILADLLKSKLPDTEIVYSKANLVSEFRHEFNMPKSRLYNELHHAKDAYLNIVVGNVYDVRFNKKWFVLNSNYSIKVRTVFTNPVMASNKKAESVDENSPDVVWLGKPSIAKIKKIVDRNDAHYTKYSTFKTGGLFDQQPVKAKEGLVPFKKGIATEKYGGYNKPSIMFFILAKYKTAKKTDTMFVPVRMIYGQKVLSDSECMEKYVRDFLETALNTKIESIDYPLGLRPIKINTVIEADGFRMCISGSGGGGKRLLVQPMVSFASVPKWNEYIKWCERLVEKAKNNPKFIYDIEYDKVNSAENLELYDLYIDKLVNTIYKKRPCNPVEALVAGREKFISLSEIKQAEVILNVHQIFGKLNAGADLSLLGASKFSGKATLSSSLSNLKKYYSEIRIIDESASGMFKKRSINLFNILDV